MVAFKASDSSSTKGTDNNSTAVLAASVWVFNIVYSVLAESSDKSNEIVGVLEVLLVTLIDLMTTVESAAAVNKVVSEVVANATQVNL